MKKDRNAFFNEANFSQTSYMGAPNMPMPPQNFASQASQNFYANPMPFNYNPNMNKENDYSDYESRLNKIERQINRLDARISKLESKGLVTTENFDNTTNMYML